MTGAGRSTAPAWLVPETRLWQQEDHGRQSQNPPIDNWLVEDQLQVQRLGALLDGQMPKWCLPGGCQSD